MDLMQGQLTISVNEVEDLFLFQSDTRKTINETTVLCLESNLSSEHELPIFGKTAQQNKS